MADRSILFSAPMVRAILREIECPGTGKTQTRRVLDAWCDEPPAFVRDGVIMALDCVDRPYRWPRTHAVGDRLWVREAWRVSTMLDAVPPRDMDRCTMPEYLADSESLYKGRIRASMHLPRWASRLTLTVTDVRVERLQDISEAGAQAEGVQRLEGPSPVLGHSDWTGPVLGHPMTSTYVEAYARLWDDIHGHRAWHLNPWVAAYTFTVERRNTDTEASDV